MSHITPDYLNKYNDCLRVANSAVALWASLIPFFPSDPYARATIASKVVAICEANNDLVILLEAAVIDESSRWEGIPGIRAIFKGHEKEWRQGLSL